MRLEPVSILAQLRELWLMPRDMERFAAYLEQVKGGPGGEIMLPLVAANPMAKPHMIAFVDKLEALGADDILREACAEAGRRLARSPLDTRLSLVPIDDVGGAWSEKTQVDFANRFGEERLKGRANIEKYRYVTANAYASEEPSRELVHARILAAAYRAAYVLKHGGATTVREMMRQEGMARRFAAVPPPEVDVDALRAALAPHLDATLHATRFAAVYGDAAAVRVGHKPLGLPEGAALHVGLADALASSEEPEDLI